MSGITLKIQTFQILDEARTSQESIVASTKNSATPVGYLHAFDGSWATIKWLNFNEAVADLGKAGTHLILVQQTAKGIELLVRKKKQPQLFKSMKKALKKGILVEFSYENQWGDNKKAAPTHCRVQKIKTLSEKTFKPIADSFGAYVGKIAELKARKRTA